MKKIFIGMIALTLLFSMVGCGRRAGMVRDPLADNNQPIVQTTAPTTAAPAPMGAAELEAAIAKQEVHVTSVKYVVQHEEYKALYPDLMQAVFKNGSNLDLKNVVVAFAAWDANNLPLKIKGQYDFGDTYYVKKCNFNDINLIPGKSYGSDSGLALDSKMSGVEKIKAIVVSYESFDGDTWENPLYEAWLALYEGKRYIG